MRASRNCWSCFALVVLPAEGKPLGGLVGALYGGVCGGGWNLRLERAAGVSISESGEGWTRTDGHGGRRAREFLARGNA